jgi:hypothetical protein
VADNAGVRVVVREGLVAAGHDVTARLTGEDMSFFDEIPAAFLPDWRFYQFSTVPHPANSFVVAVGADTVILLTERPAAFSDVLRGSRASVSDAGTAVEVARLYLTTTRPMTSYTLIIDSVDDLELRAELTPDEQRRRDRAYAELRGTVRPASAERQDGGFVVTVFVQAGQDVERRTVTIAADGTVTEHGASLAERLPTVITL